MEANAAKTDRAPCPRCGALVTRHSRKGLCRRCIARVTLPQSEKSSPTDTGLRVRCPQCGHSIGLAEGTGLSDICCDSCGTHFKIVDDHAASQSVVGLGQVGQFEILEKLGTGAFGTVWKARDKRLDRWVAIKIPRQRHLEPAEAEKFLREARAAAQLHHPNIVSVFEVGRDDDLIYIVCDFVEGVSLAEWLTGRRVSPRDAAQLCRKIAAALEHAHEQGVIHRDIKPGNILLDTKGEPHLADFGLARREAGEVTLTLDGQLLGTPAYMSPEQARGEAHQADPRSDLYSLGVLLFQLLTGELPFRGNTRMLVHQVIHDDPPSPRKLNAHVPRDLETICLKCLEKEPGRRYDSARSLGEELDRFIRDEPIHARPIGPVGRTWRWSRRKPALAAALASLVAVFAAGFIGVFTQWRRAEGQAEVTRLNLYAADTFLAHHAAEENNLGRARALLETHRPGRGQRDLRGFEWRYLWDQTRGDEVFTYWGHSNIVNCAIFSPDGQFLVSAGFDQRVHVLDFGDRKTRVILEGFGNTTCQNALAFSSDGRLMAATGDGKTLIWEVPAWKLAKELPGPSWAVAFNPMQPELAVDTKDGVTVWSIRDWTLQHRFEHPAVRLQAGLAFSPDATVLVALSDDMVSAWDLRSDKQQPVFTNAVNKPLSVACSSQLLAVGDWFGRIQVWDWTSWKQMADFQAHPMFTWGMGFSPSGELLATGGGDQLIHLWDTRTFQSRGSLRGQEHEVWSVRFSPDGRWILTAGKDETVRLWPAQPLPRQLSLPGAWMPLWFSQDSREMLTINFDKGIDRWSLPSGQHLGRLMLAEEPPGFPSPERVWAISADGRRLAIGEADHELRLWVSGGAKLLHRIRPAGSVLWMGLSPSSRFVAVGTDQSCIQVWDFESGREVVALREAGPAFAFAANDRLLAFHRPPYRVAVYDLEARRIVATLPPHHWFVNELAFTPDNRTLISASADNTVRLWDVRTWRLSDVLRGDLGGLVSVTLSPDARTIATWSADQTLRLWHYETRKEVLSFKTPEAWLMFSPDGTWLAAGGGYYAHHPGAGMQLWHAPPLANAERP